MSNIKVKINKDFLNIFPIVGEKLKEDNYIIELKIKNNLLYNQKFGIYIHPHYIEKVIEGDISMYLL